MSRFFHFSTKPKIQAGGRGGANLCGGRPGKTELLPICGKNPHFENIQNRQMLAANQKAPPHPPKPGLSGFFLCRAELTASQRTSYTKRRKQIWEALHPEEIRVAQAAPVEIGYGKPPVRPTGFASATAESTGQSKATTNRALARADALGDEALAKVVNTSLARWVFCA